MKEHLIGSRGKLIHDYFGVNIDIVLNIVKEYILGLLLKIKTIFTYFVLRHGRHMQIIGPHAMCCQGSDEKAASLSASGWIR